MPVRVTSEGVVISLVAVSDDGVWMSERQLDEAPTPLSNVGLTVNVPPRSRATDPRSVRLKGNKHTNQITFHP